ncbi:hypothetical protein [Actinoplanes sp. NPDC026623]|uniref:hypothetical protein n=1 Tax=Actinoplanes sp. NPDC026623 TaxID=3155610 RepID=UPI0033C3020C
MANVVDERPAGPGGEETKRGLRIFRPDAKVYVVDGFGGMGWETVTVVGQARKSARWVTAHVQAKNLHNFRVKLVYTPASLRRITQLRRPKPDDPDRCFGGFWLGWVDDCGNEAYRRPAGWRRQRPAGRRMRSEPARHGGRLRTLNP